MTFDVKLTLPPQRYLNKDLNSVNHVEYTKLVRKLTYKINSKNHKHKNAFLNLKARDLYVEYHYSSKLKMNGRELLTIDMPSYYHDAMKIIKVPT